MEHGEDIEALWRPVLAEGGDGEPRAGVTYRGTLDGVAMRPDRLKARVVVQTLTPHATLSAGEPAALPPEPAGDAAAPPGYTIEHEIGSGGMGVVYRARQRVLARDIALKTARDNAGEKFVAEALVTAGLEHPNIVPVYDLTTTANGHIALAMKLVGGMSWDRALHPEAEDPPARDLDFHLDVLLAVANAIAFAHSHGIAHLDIKPDNVLLGAYGEVLVVDWGIALDFRDAPDAGAVAPPKSALRTPCGTPTYLPPELARAVIKDIGPTTDVYLLGATLYEIATGRSPRKGLSMVLALIEAALGKPPVFQEADAVPEPLRAIIMRAMAARPVDRYPNVAAFQDAIRDFRAHRASLVAAERARMSLDACRRARASGEHLDPSRLYSDFAEAAASYRQAFALWAGNDEAAHGEQDARLELAETARDLGDFGLAATQTKLVIDAERTRPAQRDAARALSATIEPLRRARVRAKLVARLLIVAVIIALIAIGAMLIVVQNQKESAEASHQLAVTRLADIQRLSDVKRLAELREAAGELWPATPERAGALGDWLLGAKSLVGRLPEHRATLAGLDAGVRDPTSVVDRWERDTLADLVSGIEDLAARTIPEVERRLATASSLTRLTLEGPREQWSASIAAVRASPTYRGLALTPQLGLVPLGPDPHSGLQEFAHVASGAIPTRGSDGRLSIDEATGIVLVLLPGGAFDQGAIPPDAEHPAGTANVDPEARPHEGPVARVTLAPFFIGKHEVTQAQWQRIEGANPSAYLPDRTIGGRKVTALHPVEQMSYNQSASFLRKIALTLPSEAQWEYAARAGTTSVYWTGDAPESLAGTLNIADEWCRTHEGPGSWRYETWLDDGYTSHAPVGTYRANPFGLHDMRGNVWEWCADRFAAYTTPAAPGSGLRAGDPKQPFAFRGGGFRSNANHARSADRYSVAGVDHRGFDVGLRAARALDP